MPEWNAGFFGQKDNAIAMFWKFNEYAFRSELKCHERLMTIFDFLTLECNFTSTITRCGICTSLYANESKSF